MLYRANSLSKLNPERSIGLPTAKMSIKKSRMCLPGKNLRIGRPFRLAGNVKLGCRQSMSFNNLGTTRR
jgi:hypothetical protein